MNTDYDIHISKRYSYTCSIYSLNAVMCIDNEYILLLFLHTKMKLSKYFNCICRSFKCTIIFKHRPQIYDTYRFEVVQKSWHDPSNLHFLTKQNHNQDVVQKRNAKR